MNIIILDKERRHKMTINEVITKLEELKKVYGNVSVKMFDYTAWDTNAEEDMVDINEITFDDATKSVSIF